LRNLSRPSADGDWLQPNQVASLEDISQQTSAFNFLRTLRVAINAAAVLGEAADAERYTARFFAAAALYNSRWFNSSGSGCYGTGRQNEQIYPLYLSINPGGDAALETFAAACLLPAIAANGTHVDTGIISTKYLMPLLSRAGRSDVALALAANEDFPSWGGMALAFNMTTVSEHWNPLNNPSGNHMSSRNHPALGSVGSWLYQALLGVRLGDEASADFFVPGLPPGAGSRPAQDGYGFARAVVAPEVVTSPLLPGASGGVATAAGFVGAAWAYTALPNPTLSLNASFPVGCSGEVRSPGGGLWGPSRTIILEGANRVWDSGDFVAGAAEGVVAGAACGRARDRVCLQVQPGDYIFTMIAATGA